MFSSAVGTTAFRYTSGNSGKITRRKSICQGLSWPLDYRMFLSFRYNLAYFKFIVGLPIRP